MAFRLLTPATAGITVTLAPRFRALAGRQRVPSRPTIRTSVSGDSGPSCRLGSLKRLPEIALTAPLVSVRPKPIPDIELGNRPKDGLDEPLRPSLPRQNLHHPACVVLEGSKPGHAPSSAPSMVRR